MTTESTQTLRKGISSISFIESGVNDILHWSKKNNPREMEEKETANS